MMDIRATGTAPQHRPIIPPTPIVTRYVYYERIHNVLKMDVKGYMKKCNSTCKSIERAKSGCYTLTISRTFPVS